MEVFEKHRLRHHLLLDLLQLDFLLGNYLENHQNLLQDQNFLHYQIHQILQLVILELGRDQRLLLILHHYQALKYILLQGVGLDFHHYRLQ